MKIYKEKRYIEENIIDGKSTIYGMANLKPRETNQPFELWVDEIGSDRNVSHNLPRFKPKANRIQLDIVLNPNGKAEIVNADQRKIRKFAYAKDAIQFIEKFHIPLLMHWNGEISSSELANIIRLVIKKHYSIDEATDTVISDEF